MVLINSEAINLVATATAVQRTSVVHSTRTNYFNRLTDIKTLLQQQLQIVQCKDGKSREEEIQQMPCMKIQKGGEATQ